MGKKKVKLNPLKRPSNEERRGPKLTHETNYGLEGDDRTLPIVPIAGEDPFGANVNVIIGGKNMKASKCCISIFTQPCRHLIKIR